MSSHSGWILGFSGGIASGKTSISMKVAEQLGWKWASFGDLVREEARLRGLSHERRVLQNLGQALVERELHTFCAAMLRSLNWELGRNGVIDGIRHREVLLELRRIAAPARVDLIHLFADVDTREHRIEDEGDSSIRKVEDHEAESQSRAILVEYSSLVVDSRRPIKECVNAVLQWIEETRTPHQL